MTKRTISARIDPVVDTALRNMADSEGITLTELIERALIELVGVCPTCGRPLGRDDVA